MAIHLPLPRIYTRMVSAVKLFIDLIGSDYKGINALKHTKHIYKDKIF